MDCCTIKAARGAVIFREVAYWWAVCFTGLVIPRPPRRTGSANRSGSSSLKALRPVREGRN